MLRIFNGSFLSGTYPIEPDLCDGLLNLAISDAHKFLLIKNRKTVPLLILGLFLDIPDWHPRGLNAPPPATPTPEHIQATVPSPKHITIDHWYLILMLPGTGAMPLY